LKNKYKAIITAIGAISLTIVGLDVAIGGQQAGYPPEYGLGALVVPALLWIGVIHFYQQHKKENKQTVLVT
jgi:hypothetical protein